MPSSYTNLGFEKQADGENDGTWGSKVNTVFEQVEEAIAGVVSITLTATGKTLSITNGATGDAIRHMSLDLDGTPTAVPTMIIPNVQKTWLVRNNTGKAVQIRTATGSTATIAAGMDTILQCDGSNVVAQAIPNPKFDTVTADTIISSNVGTQNLIINPEFLYDQESYSGTTSVGGANDYISDQWEIVWDGTIGSRYTISQEENGGVSGSRKWLKLLCTTAAASPSTGQFQYVRQQLEAQAIRPSLLNSSQKVGAMRFSMDMFVHADGASSITFPAQVGVFVITQDGTARQFVENVSITSADTWQRVTLEVDADTVATIDNNNGAGLTVGFNLVAEADRQTTGGAWENSGNDTHQSGAINIADATNNYIGITAVKLEPGTTATPFVSEDYEIGLGRCEYFAQAIVLEAGGSNHAAEASATTSAYSGEIGWNRKMRTKPSASILGSTPTIRFRGTDDAAGFISSVSSGGSISVTATKRGFYYAGSGCFSGLVDGLPGTLNPASADMTVFLSSRF